MNEIAEYFNGRADDWEINFNNPSPVQGAVAAIAGIGPNSRVLDLGCGTGIMADVYLDLKAKEVVALDLAPRMIEIAQEKYAEEPSLDFRCLDVLDLQDSQGFDAVVIYNAYPHFLDKQALVEKIKELLAPSGRFVVAHSMGYEQMNEHHANLPTSVSSPLLPAAKEAAVWEESFTIDSMVDAPDFYCFAGSLK